MKSAYFADPGINASLLKNILASPADFLAASKADSKDTRSTIFGTAVHCYLLEPYKFAEQYALQPENWGPRSNGTPGGKKWTEFKKTNKGKICLGYEEKDLLCNLISVKLSHQPFMRLMQGNPIIEQPYYYDDLRYGRLKCCPDILTQDKKFIWDLKTTCKRIDDESLSNTIFFETYHFQAAHYIYVLSKLGFDIQGFGWIFVSTDTPAVHIVMRTANKQMIEAGKKDHMHALHLLKNCRERNNWPGFDTSIKEIGLPAFAERIYS
jgi:hypothetical protein